VLAERIRVCAPSGEVIIVDAVLPRSAWRRLQAQVIRRADRGRFMRRQDELEGLFPQGFEWRIQRRTYTWNGLEMLIGRTKKN
jgi:hypothetical protein